MGVLTSSCQQSELSHNGNPVLPTHRAQGKQKCIPTTEVKLPRDVTMSLVLPWATANPEGNDQLPFVVDTSQVMGLSAADDFGLQFFHDADGVLFGDPYGSACAATGTGG
jgi:hypothetical protein